MTDIQELRLNYAFVPKRFKNASLNDFEQDVIDDVQKFIKVDDWAALVILGNVGTGKTHLGCAIVREVCKERNAIYTTAYSMAQRVIADKNADFFNKYPVLVIDEISRKFDTKAENQRFFDIINFRYENLLPVVLLGNVDIESTMKSVGNAVADRLKENLAGLVLTGKSKRGMLI